MAAILTLAAAAAGSEPATKKFTYEDDVLPIFRDNCLKCHNPDKLKGDLDLTSFSATIKGGGSGVTLNAGDAEGSQLFKSILQTDEPSMPPNAKLSEKDITTIRKWIEGGMLQGAGSKALAASKPTVDLSLKSVASGKPEGPPPMPGALPLDPVATPLRSTALTAIAHSPWAPIVALAGAKQVVLYNTLDLEFVGVLPFPEGSPSDVKFSRNGKLLLAGGGRGGHSGLVTVWDITTAERVITIGDQFDSVLAADLSSDQRWIALGGPDRVLKIYNTRDGSLAHRIKKHTEWVTAVEFSPDGKYLATGDRNGGIVLWEAENGQEMFTLPGHKGAITAISWRGDSEMFLSASEDGTLKFWKASDGSALRSITAHNGGALDARFTHDARIVSSGRDNKIQIWDSAGKNLRALPFTGDLPNRVTFSNDGSKVIASDWVGRVFVWDAKTGKTAGELNPNPPTVSMRIEQGTELVGTLRAELNRAAAAQTASDAAVKAAQAEVVKSKSVLAQAGADLARKEAQLTKEPGTPEAAPVTGKKSPSDALRATIAALQKRIVGLEKQANEAAKQLTSALKTAETAKSAVDDVNAKLTRASASLARWQAAQKSGPTKSAAAKPATNKVSQR